MQIDKIMPPTFKESIGQIAKYIQTRISVDDADVEIIEEILRGELKDYYDIVDLYYEEEYCVAVASARNSAYDAGYDDGYAAGYDEGYSEK